MTTLINPPPKMSRRLPSSMGLFIGLARLVYSKSENFGEVWTASTALLVAYVSCSDVGWVVFLQSRVCPSHVMFRFDTHAPRQRCTIHCFFYCYSPLEKVYTL